VARMEDVHTGFRWGNSEGNNDLENLGIDGRIKMYLKKIGCEGGGWTGLIWLMIRKSDGLLSVC